MILVLTDWTAVKIALEALGGDPAALPKPSASIPIPQSPPFNPLSDFEWERIERHIKSSVALMRPRTAARTFVQYLLMCEHTGLSTRYLPDAQESSRQRFLRWSLDGRIETLAVDLRTAGELDEERLAAFDALAEKAKGMRQRIVGSRAVRMDKRT